MGCRLESTGMFPSFAHNVRDQQVVDPAGEVFLHFRSDRQLALFLADVGHTISN